MNELAKLPVFVDFDHTISPIHFPDELTEPPHEECRRLLSRLRELGYEVVISSCRANQSLFQENTLPKVYEMVSYLNIHKIPFTRIDRHKPLYSAVIDDRAAFVNKGDWSGIGRRLKDLIPGV